MIKFGYSFFDNWHRKLSKVLVLKAVKTALIVGSFITLINQYDAIISHEPFYPVRAVLSYCVPFLVFIYSRLSSVET